VELAPTIRPGRLTTIAANAVAVTACR